MFSHETTIAIFVERISEIVPESLIDMALIGFIVL
jgi:hypothetical protein